MTQEIKVAVQSFNEETGKWNISFNGKVFHKFAIKYWGKKIFKNSKKLRKLGVQRLEFSDGTPWASTGNSSSKEIAVEVPVEVVQSRFSIDERFEFVEELVQMVRDGVTPSMMVTGQGGLGKSFTVLEQVKDMQENRDYIVIKGFSTPKALFGLLQRNRTKLLIFDDCDSVLKDATSLNLLKSALDSFGKRRITWNSTSNDDMETSFDFEGSIIFISNMEKLPQPLVSRSYTVNLNMTTKDKLQRMKTILPELAPELRIQYKIEALEFVKKHADKIKDLNFRTLIKVAKIRKGARGDWEKMAEYMTMEDQA